MENKKKKGEVLKWARRYARILDSNFKIPGTNFSFGLDPIIGLIPGLGDAVSMGFQFLLVVSLLRNGSSGELRAKLILNVLLDSAIGAIPIIGQIWDFFYKANERNLRLTQEYLLEDKHQGSGKGIWLAVLALVIITMVMIVYAFVWFVNWVIGLFF
ncbi:DUF4112 domain-containing protein [Owenweeksia hongkongensis]|uniref:DUF4112 domain-containing protein n=1 Tax=Owenweeksia hongkongensis TaxID=253245 RepID=UPI003A92336D